MKLVAGGSGAVTFSSDELTPLNRLRSSEFVGGWNLGMVGTTGFAASGFEPAEFLRLDALLPSTVLLAM
jgi:hypothetical protein